MQKGFVQIYFGYGKGKSTAVAGLILRCISYGLKVALFRFFKIKNTSSEDKVLQKYKSNVTIFYSKSSSPMFSINVPIDKIINSQKKLFETAKGILYGKKKYDVIILDEGLDLVKYKIIATNELIQFIQSKPKDVEIILTGHYINRKIKKYADLVTYFKKIKHYYDKGVKARQGIEF